MRKRLFRELREFMACEALTIVTAIVVVTLLHDQVLEAYPVPTRSMEPTIEGDSRLGDRVLVDKLWDDLSQPRRFDLVVFWREAEQKTIVKRVVALPGEWVRIHDGDLFVGQRAEDLRRIVKRPARDHDMFRRLWDSSIDPGFTRGFLRSDGASRLLGGGAVELLPEGVDEAALFGAPGIPGVPGHAPFALAFGRRLTTGYIDGFDRLQDSTFMARDFGATLDLSGEPASRLWIELRYGDRCFLLEYDGKGRSFLWSGEAGRYTALGPAQGSEVPPLGHEPQHLVFCFLDGHLQLSVGDRDLWAVPLDPETIPAYTMNGLALAATRAPVRIDRLQVVHDFHYTSFGYHQSRYAVEEPYYVGEDRLFVLGDNSEDSSDSRMMGSIARADLRGRPWMIVSPLRRLRLLTR